MLKALARLAFGHNKQLKSIAAAYWKPQSNSLLTSLPSLTQVKSACGGYSTSHQVGSIVSRVSNDNPSEAKDGRVSSSSPLVSGVMHGSPLSDDSSQHSDSAMMNDTTSNGIVNSYAPRQLDSEIYTQCIFAMCTLAKDPSPRIASLGRRVLSIIGIEQVVTKPLKSSSSVRSGDVIAGTSSLAGLARSSSWFDMHATGIYSSWLDPLY